MFSFFTRPSSSFGEVRNHRSISDHLSTSCHTPFHSEVRFLRQVSKVWRQHCCLGEHIHLCVTWLLLHVELERLFAGNRETLKVSCHRNFKRTLPSTDSPFSRERSSSDSTKPPGILTRNLPGLTFSRIFIATIGFSCLVARKYSSLC